DHSRTPRFFQPDRIPYFLAALLWRKQGFYYITRFCIRHKRPFVLTRMSDIQLLWECTTTPSPPQEKNTAQQGVRQTLHQLSDSWKQKNSPQCSKKEL
ncbi:MAG: hypothetical protein WAR76_25500, partial [Xanthobacteraceae bacterium]